MIIHIRNRSKTDLFIGFNGNPSALLSTGKTLDIEIDSQNVVLQIGHPYDSYCSNDTGRMRFVIVLDSEIRLYGLMLFDTLDLCRELCELPGSEAYSSTYDRIALFCRADLGSNQTYFTRRGDALIPVYRKHMRRERFTDALFESLYDLLFGACPLFLVALILSLFFGLKWIGYYFAFVFFAFAFVFILYYFGNHLLDSHFSEFFNRLFFRNRKKNVFEGETLTDYLEPDAIERYFSDSNRISGTFDEM